VHPGVERILVSAKKGEGIDQWRDWLTRVAPATPAEEGAPTEAVAAAEVRV
jgi:hypothetical protein